MVNCRIGWFAATLSLLATPVTAMSMGVAVQVSNGKKIPTQAQLEQILRPGDMVRDVLGWHKVDAHCDLTRGRQIEIPGDMMTLYQRVQAAGGLNFVTLAFNNRHCGQPGNSGAQAFPDTPALRAEFAAYAAEVARRVPALGAISIWNELDGTWNGGIASQPERLRQYCLLANAVIIEVRKVNKTLPIAIGASIGPDIDNWFIEMFDQRGCMGKADPTVWLDVHPYLSGHKIAKAHKLDFTLWRSSIANMRSDGITNPLAATEWGAKAAFIWQTAHPAGDYMTKFQNEVLSRDPGWATALWYEMLYDRRAPNAGLYDKSDALTAFGTRYLAAFGN